MGSRSEQRIAISFPVIVRGVDTRGTPFVVSAETRDINVSGARLRGLDHFATPGKKVEIEYKNQKAWYRIQWIGEPGTPSSGQVGLRCLEPGKYIWGVQPKEWAPDTYDPLHPEIAEKGAGATVPDGYGSNSWDGDNRRRFERRACRIEIHITAQGSSVRVNGKITDISLGGCYVEMLAPLPLKSRVELEISIEGAPLHLSGTVRSSQTGLGMGIAFVGMSPDDYERLRAFAPPSSRGAVRDPAYTSTPQHRGNTNGDAIRRSGLSEPPIEQLSVSTDTVEAIVRILFRKGFLTPSEIAEEIEKLRTARV